MSITKIKKHVHPNIYKYFSRLIIKGGSRFYYLLDFGGYYGVFWRLCIIPDAVEEIVHRKYYNQKIDNIDRSKEFITGLAFTTENKNEAIIFIKKNTAQKIGNKKNEK